MKTWINLNITLDNCYQVEEALLKDLREVISEAAKHDIPLSFKTGGDYEDVEPRKNSSLYNEGNLE